jgi:hypothetical protein
MSKNILIYNDLKNINKIFINNKKYPNLTLYNKKIYLLYDAKEINPPFFDSIIINNDNLSVDDLKMIYNMTKFNGNIIYTKKYYNFFNNNNNDKDINDIKEYHLLKKKNNIVYLIEYTRVVDFIIMGVQKAGTTALALNIGKHPDIYIDITEDPRKSEIHFFDLNWKKGIDWYKNKFNYNKKIVGEKTPDLIYLDYTFPLIQSINPYVKIILILRNPVDRAYSAWKMISKRDNSNINFEEAIQDELDNKLNENITFFTSQTHYLQRGLYYKQIKNLLKWFPKENILILISEKVIDNMNEEYNKVYSFLNLKNINTNYKVEFMSDDKSIIDKKLYNKLISFFKKDILQLEKFLKIKTGWLQ